MPLGIVPDKSEQSEGFSLGSPADLLKGVVNSGFESPWNGVAQLAHLPESNKFDDWNRKSLLGNAGAIVGMAADFVALSKASNLLPGVARLETSALGSAAKVGALGAFYGGVLTPSAPGESRFKTALTEGLTFGTMGGVSKFMEPANRSLASALKVGAVSGAAGGFAHTEASSLLNDHKFVWSPTELGTNMGKYAAVGTVFGAGSHLAEKGIRAATNYKGEHQAQSQAKNTADANKSNTDGSKNSPEQSATEIKFSELPQPASRVVAAENLQREIPSFWAKKDNVPKFPAVKGEVHSEVAVVGGGVGGAQIARELGTKGINTVLVDGHRLAEGTSNKMGALISTVPDLGFSAVHKLYGPEAFGRILQSYKNGYTTVVDTAKTTNSGYRPAPGYDLYPWYNSGKGKKEVELLRQFGSDEQFVTGDAASKILPGFKGIAVRPEEGNLNPAKYVQQIAATSNFRTFEQSPVTGLTTGKPGEPITLHTPDGKVIANNVIFATGGPAPKFEYLNERLSAAQCFALQAKYDGKLNGNFVQQTHPDPRISYFRDLGDGNLLFGGAGRPLPLQKPLEQSPLLIKRMQKLFPDAKPQQMWSGTIYISKDGLPILAQHPEIPGLWNATGLGGSGLVHGAMVAKEFGQQMLGRPASENWMSPQRFESGKKAAETPAPYYPRHMYAGAFTDKVSELP